MGDGLAARVRNKRQGGAELDRVEPRSENEGRLLDKVRAMQVEYQIAMPRGLEAVQLIRDAVTAVRKEPRLAQCQADTVLGGLMTFAQLGLRVGVLGHGWLLPIRDRGVLKAQVVIGYKGYVSLAFRGTSVQGIQARTIREGDYYDVEYGLDERLVHRPGNDSERGAPVGYYCVARLGSGGRVWHYMSHPDMEAWRDRYAMARAYENGKQKLVDGRPVILGPWRDHFEQMAHKTEWLRCAPWVPLSTELAYGIEADEKIRYDCSAPKDWDGMIHGSERPADLPADQEPQYEQVTLNVVDPAPEPAAQPERPAPPRPATTTQKKKIAMWAGEAGLDDAGRYEIAGAMVGRVIASTDELSNREAAAVIDGLKQLKDTDDFPAAARAYLVAYREQQDAVELAEHDAAREAEQQDTDDAEQDPT